MAGPGSVGSGFAGAHPSSRQAHTGRRAGGLAHQRAGAVGRAGHAVQAHEAKHTPVGRKGPRGCSPEPLGHQPRLGGVSATFGGGEGRRNFVESLAELAVADHGADAAAVGPAVGAAARKF